jgi:hypothetical protein
MKQTAVEWLEEKLLELFENNLPFELLEEAKEMEKQQIIYARVKKHFEWYLEAEKYYNETYNK